MGFYTEKDIEIEKLHEENARLRVEVGKLHRLLQRADALVGPNEDPEIDEVHEILVKCSDANERAEAAEAEVARLAGRNGDLMAALHQSREVEGGAQTRVSDLEAELAEVRQRAEAAEAERDALRAGSDEDARALLHLNDLLVAAEARERALEAALREWREAECSPDCIACSVLDAALAGAEP